MSSGISHELNQPLAATVVFAEACYRLPDRHTLTSEFLRYILEQICKQGRRAGDFVSCLRQVFAARIQLEQVIIDLLQNALEALSENHTDNGCLRIETGSAKGHGSTITAKKLIQGTLFSRAAANTVIALELGLGESTVELHRTRMMKKLGFPTLGELMNDFSGYRQYMANKQAGSTGNKSSIQK